MNSKSNHGSLMRFYIIQFIDKKVVFYSILALRIRMGKYKLDDYYFKFISDFRTKLK